MPHASELGADAIRFERVYDAPIEDVWALWTTKDGIEEWWAPAGMRVDVLALELRAGGAFDHVMTAVGAEQVAYFTSRNRSPVARVSSRFVEIVHHRRLRIRFDIDFVPGVEPYPYDMAVELHAEGGRVRMIVTADRHPDPDMTQGAALGLTSQLQRFDLAIAARATGGAMTLMRPLLYSINVTLDGCVDHSVGAADPALLEEQLRATHRHATQSMGRADALLFGRVTYRMMEDAWRLETRTMTMPDWTEPFARKIDAMKKYVVSSTLGRVDWNAELVSGDLGEAVAKLKRLPGGPLFTGGVTLPMALAELGLIDEYEFVVQPRIAGRGRTLFAGLSRYVELKLVDRKELSSGAVALRYEPRR